MIESGDYLQLRRSYHHTAVLVNGVVKMLQSERSKNEIFNLTYGQGRSLLDLVEILRGEYPDVSIKYQPKEKLMPRRGSLSVEKARKEVGYEPEYPLERGLVQYIRWYESVMASVRDLTKNR